MSFLHAEAVARTGDSKLLKIAKLIDWRLVVAAVGDLQRSGLGPNGYDTGGLIRCLVLQSWHNLSDPALEEALKIRLDFMLFSGFEGDVPDETTICRFRKILMENKGFERMLVEVNRQLQEQNLQLSPASGAVLDATLVSSAARPKKSLEASETVAGSDNFSCETATKLSADTDATWLKKGKKSHFGYQVFAVVGEEDGAISRVKTTPANESETKYLREMARDLPTKKLLADKGFSSAENRKFLKDAGIKTRIMHKASRGKPLSKWQKLFNKAVSKTRYIVEQDFGTLKRKFLMTKSPYLGTEKTGGWANLKAICFNLLKAVNKIVNITPKIEKYA
jgi:transposase, IS5 family